jgi:Zn-dependent alcohol dehydrogenases
MKAAVVKGNSKVEIENFTISDVGSNELLIKMQSCGICGSDVEKVFGKYGQPSMRLGHEPAGEVIKIGDAISDFKNRRTCIYTSSCTMLLKKLS